MSKPKTAIVWTCAHSDPEADNKRFDWLGQLIYDLRPDYCIDLGDGADMRSLNSFDTRYPQAIVSQSYEKDIETYNDSQERLRWKLRHNKRKKPYWIGFEGNHENRITRAINIDPRLEGQRYGVSYGHLQTDHWFNDYHRYNNSGPALASYDGILYGHFVSGGNFGTAISGLHHANTLISNTTVSTTVGHSHKFDYKYKGSARPNPIHGLVAGCFKGKEEGWAGQANLDWRTGVCVKTEIENGDYNLQWISLKKLEKEYGH